MDRREALAALMSLPAATRISVANLKPTDAIVIECEGALSDDMAERIRLVAKEIWPDHKCVVLVDGLKLKVVAQ